MKLIMLSFYCCLIVTASGCSTWDKLDKTERGAVIGTGAGAAVGGVSAGTPGALIGGAAGGLTGGVIGHKLDDDEK